VAIPNVFEAGQVVEKARKLNPTLAILTRAESSTEAQHLAQHGADTVIIGHRELAQAMITQTLGKPPPLPADPRVH
jgi:CPA2 family monovalent cation:H+ antiporter-2